jgi:hypothetical protein
MIPQSFLVTRLGGAGGPLCSKVYFRFQFERVIRSRASVWSADGLPPLFLACRIFTNVEHRVGGKITLICNYTLGAPSGQAISICLLLKPGSSSLPL